MVKQLSQRNGSATQIPIAIVIISGLDDHRAAHFPKTRIYGDYLISMPIVHNP